MTALQRLRTDPRAQSACIRMNADGASPAYVRRLLRELAELPEQHAALHRDETAPERAMRLAQLERQVRRLSKSCRADPDASRLTVLAIENHADTWRTQLLRGRAGNRPSLAQLLDTIGDELAEQAGRGPVGFKQRRLTLRTFVVLCVADRLRGTGLYKRRPINDTAAFASAILGESIAPETVRTTLRRRA